MAEVDSSIYKSQGGASFPNPLDMIGKFAYAQNAMNQNRLFQQTFAARKALGPLAQASIDPKTGEMDYSKFSTAISIHPETAWMAPDIINTITQRGLTQAQTIKTNLEAHQIKLGAFLNAASSLLAKGNNVKQSDFIQPMSGLVAGQILDPKEAAQYLSTLAADGPELAQQIKQFALQAEGSKSALDHVIGTLQSTDAGGTTSLNLVSGVTGVHHVGDIAHTPTPGERNALTDIVTPNSTKLPDGRTLPAGTKLSGPHNQLFPMVNGDGSPAGQGGGNALITSPMQDPAGGGGGLLTAPQGNGAGGGLPLAPQDAGPGAPMPTAGAGGGGGGTAPMGGGGGSVTLPDGSAEAPITEAPQGAMPPAVPGPGPQVSQSGPVTAPGMGGAQVTGLSPATEKNLQGAATAAGDNIKQLQQDVQTFTPLLTHLGYMRDLSDQFKPGAQQEWRYPAARIAQAMPFMPQKTVDAIADGDFGAVQTFRKESVQNIMQNLRESMGGQGRIAVLEFQVFMDNNPDIYTDPRALHKIYDFVSYQAKLRTMELSSAEKWNELGRDPTQFTTNWNKYLVDKGLINYGGMKPEQVKSVSEALMKGPE